MNFLDSYDARAWIRHGYEELATPDGDRYFYVHRADYDPTIVGGVVTVERDGDGWTVSAWEVSCG